MILKYIDYDAFIKNIKNLQNHMNLQTFIWKRNWAELILKSTS